MNRIEAQNSTFKLNESTAKTNLCRSSKLAIDVILDSKAHLLGDLDTCMHPGYISWIGFSSVVRCWGGFCVLTLRGFSSLVDLTIAQRVNSSSCRLSVWLSSSGIRCSVGSLVFC